MNLPSIFKSSSDMKGKPQQSTPARKDLPPQDMFGLGIQVFKIDSKKESMNNSSAGKARQNMKNFENPSKKAMTPSSQVPKSKKISGLLPNIYGEQQKEIKVSNNRTQTILSKKVAQKRLTSTNKIESIKQIMPKRPPPQSINQKNIPHETNKGQKITKPPLKQNKTTERISQNPQKNQPEQTQQQQKIVKIDWRTSLNDLTKFYVESDEYQKNLNTKMGRKKAQQYIGEHENFIKAFVEKEEYFYRTADEYDEFGIENYSTQKGFRDISYQNFVVQ